MLRDIPIDRIFARSDARAIDPATVGGLADSIGAVGLINPIRVRAVGDQWEVIAGMHRLAACKQLGLVEIQAHVVTDDDLHAELAMIDENLCRAELSPVDRAKQTARRKAIYLELHPETGHGKASPIKDDNLSSFADETAAVIGKDKRTVQRDAERGEKVIDEVMDLIRGTKLDTGSYLDKLKSQTPNDQFRAATRDLAHIRAQEREKARGGIARRVVRDVEDVTEKQFEALMSAWNKAGADARQRFLDAIDVPVFDRSAA